MTTINFSDISSPGEYGKPLPSCRFDYYNIVMGISPQHYLPQGLMLQTETISNAAGMSFRTGPFIGFAGPNAERRFVFATSAYRGDGRGIENVKAGFNRILFGSRWPDGDDPAAGRYDMPVSLELYLPGTQTKAKTDHVAIVVSECEPGQAPQYKFEAFNAAGTLLQTFNGVNNQTVTIDRAQGDIHRVKFTPSTLDPATYAGGSEAIRSIEFGTLTAA